MKLLATAVLSALIAACFASVALAQGNPRGTTTITLKGKKISIEYGRPSLKGRSTDDLLGQLTSGSFWRMGADTSTTLTTAADLVFADAVVPAGQYSLWLQRAVDASTWNLIVNKQHGQWGTDHDRSQDLVFIPLKQSKAHQSVETLTETLRKAGGGGTITIKWGMLVLSAGFKAK
ncbi:MAG: DUF2911 domain-containing protein [Terriglobia bacterium]